MASAIYLMVDKDGWTGGFQLSVGDDDGGYRIAGPKFNGSSEMVIRHRLSARDVRELSAYLAKFNEDAA